MKYDKDDEAFTVFLPWYPVVDDAMQRDTLLSLSVELRPNSDLSTQKQMRKSASM